MTVSLFDLRRMDFARKLPERARLMRDDMLRADAAVSAATALIPFSQRHPRLVTLDDETQPTDVHKKGVKASRQARPFQL
jgi:hypothetical protein